MAFFPVMSPILLQDSGPHPTGHLGAHTPALSSHSWHGSSLAWCFQSSFQEKWFQSWPGKFCIPTTSCAGLTQASLYLPTKLWLTHQLFIPTAHPNNTTLCLKYKGKTTRSNSCWFSPSVSQDQAFLSHGQPEGFTLLLSQFTACSRSPSNAAILSLSALLRCI